MKETRTGWAIKVWHPDTGPHFKRDYLSGDLSVYTTRDVARTANRMTFDPRYFKMNGLPVPRVVKVQVTVEVIA